MTQDRRSPAPARIQVDGVGFDPLDQSAAIERLISSFHRGVGGRVVFVNLDVLVKMRRRPELTGLVAPAELVFADGMPVIWASRLQRTPLPERVAGASLLGQIAARCAADGIPVMLLGGRPGCAERAVAALEAAHPALRAGWHAPPYGFEDDPGAGEAIDGALEGFGRGVCFVGLGFPKQERLMADLAAKRPDWWFVASGGSIDFLAHDDRAPIWMQQAGLEWLYRLRREPRRLARRYLIEDLPFAVRLLLAAFLGGLRHRRSRS